MTISSQDEVSVSISSCHSADDWLAKDYDIPTRIFLRVEPGTTASTKPRWSIAWLIGGKEPSGKDMTAIRYISALETPDCLIDLADRRLWKSSEPMTASWSHATAAKLYSLTTADRKARQEIERLAQVTIVTSERCYACGQHGSQAWIKELLSAMVSANLLQNEELAEALTQATSS
ncbi:hypothetical protein FKP32DRAFT_861108 [Trametes sanguinea]|nr:hypothetical protein FKP32DRAFT_861108 [Trametes sanguinea]